MAIEVFMIGLAVVLMVGGVSLGLLVSYREFEGEERAREASKAPRLQPSGFFGLRSRDEALIADLTLRQIEHHLRQEVMHAERFLEDPRPETLRAGTRSSLELQ